MITNLSKARVIYRPRGRAQEYSPLAVNLYTGCGHGCKYCYVPDCLRRNKQEFHSRVFVRKNIIENILHDVKVAQIKEEVLLCFTCDPYTIGVQADPYNWTTRKVLEIFNEHNVKFQVLTKAGMKPIRDFRLYKTGDKFAVTLTFLDPTKSRQIEPYAASPEDRIEGLRAAKENNIQTWVSFEPAMDEEEIHHLIELSAPYTDFYKVGKCSKYKSGITDWPGFVQRVKEHLQAVDKPFMLKKDLKQFEI